MAHRALSATPLVDESTDQCVVLHGIPWEQYEALTQAIGESSAIRTAYLEGELQLMSPGWQHEYVERFLGRLVEAFADARELSLNCFGHTTLRRKAKRSGLEPDNCYILGPEKKVPDLAIEVVVTSGGVDKLEVYRRLGVREVWFWLGGKIAIHVLGPDATYRRTRRSRVLRVFPVAQVERILAESDRWRQTETVREFRRSLG